MKTKLLLVAAILFSATAFSQSKIKIKGNKVQLETAYELPSFDTVEIDDDLQINFSVANFKNTFVINTDENLHDKITYEVKDSILKITSTFYKLSPSKKIELTLNTTDFSKLIVKNKANVKQVGFFKKDSTDFAIEMFDDSKLKIDLKAKNINLKMSQYADVEFVFQTDTLNVVMNDKTDAKGTVSCNFTDIQLYKNADLEMDGSVTILKGSFVGSPKLKAKKLLTAEAKINESISADVYLNVSKKVNVYLTDDTKIYLYGMPEVEVDGIRDTAQIIKKK